MDECPKCGADLSDNSVLAVDIRKIKENPRVYAINVIVDLDCCPACREIQGTYAKDALPQLPVKGCSHALGCRCRVQPLLEEIYP